MEPENTQETMQVDIAEIERAAEERGYIRGRNERIAELMAKPSMWQDETMNDAASGGIDPDGAVPTILQNMHRSIWDQ